MGHVIKIGDSYYIEFEARGLKYQQKAGDNEAQARSLLESIEAKIRQGEMSAVVRDAPIPVFIKDFFEFAQQNYSPKTAVRLKSAAEHFFVFVGRQYPAAAAMSSITPKVIEEYKFFLSQGGSKPWVVNFTLLLLREMFEYAIKLGHLNDNPTLHIRFVPDGRRPNTRVKNNQAAREFLAKGDSLFLLVRFLKLNDILRAMPFYPFLQSRI